MIEMDRTAMTDRLTTGQEIVVWWETSTSVSEPADLADRIDAELERLRAALRLIINRYDGREDDALVMKGIAREALGDE